MLNEARRDRGVLDGFSRARVDHRARDPTGIFKRDRREYIVTGSKEEMWSEVAPVASREYDPGVLGQGYDISASPIGNGKFQEFLVTLSLKPRSGAVRLVLE